jgi:RNA polymerase sigma-32 factor
VRACLPFVISIALEYRRWRVPLEDLVQQGNLGLLRAAAKFDPERGCRLATYAAPWIRAEIREYVVRTHRIVRLGSTHTERAAIRRFRDGSAATPEELAARSGMPVSRARALWPVLAEGDAELGERAIDPRTPEDAVASEEERGAVRRAMHLALEAMDRRERRIVEARMLADEPRTLAELGEEMGVSRERVRQLEVRARSALREALGPLAA